MSHLRSQLPPQPIDVTESLKGVFPFTHLMLTTSGRAAEHLLYKAWPTKGTVLQNLLFPTGIFHQIDNGFGVRGSAGAEVFGSARKSSSRAISPSGREGTGGQESQGNRLRMHRSGK